MNNLKDIVPIQQEKDLKELGFNFENEHCYLKQKLGLFQVKEPYNTFDLILFSQAFRFFREKYNVQSHIEWNKSDHVWFTFKIYFERLATGENPPVMVGHYVNSWLGLNLEFNTYEEAELACLIKLIEICKNK
jgi:hypothetical protein